MGSFPSGTTGLGPAVARARRPLARAGAVLAAVFLLAHLPYQPTALADVDAVNFALGLREFDPARHQPHPPGYPVYIAMGRASAAVLRAAGTPAADALLETRALVIWSVLAGALAALALCALFAALHDDTGDVDGTPVTAAAAAALVLSAPLVWASGVRPMSDLPGLAAALVAQALVVRAIVGAGGARALVLGAIAGGLAIGIRTQAFWLVAPLVAWGLAVYGRRRDWGTVAATVGGAVGACLAWAVPLLVASGGWARYRAALGTQAGDDFAWVDMLWMHPTVRRLVTELYDSLVLPWNGPVLAAVVLLLACGGAVVLARRGRRALLLLAAGFVPYGLFHLLFQETAHVRYALPLVVPVGYLAIVWIRRAIPRFVVPVTAALSVACLWIVAPQVALYAATPAPERLAIEQMVRAQPVERPGLTILHHSIARALQPTGRVRPWMRQPGFGQEWNAVVAYWRDGGSGPVWLLADAQRPDLTPLVDPAVVRATAFRWPLADAGVFGGTRPTDVIWYRIERPRWWLDTGWALTPELAGLARLAGRSPSGGGIGGTVRRADGPVQVLIGGRHLGPATDPPLAFELAIDGRVLERWEALPARAFLEWFTWPGVPAGDGTSARLTVTARTAGRGPGGVPAAVEQFDLQPAGALVTAYGRGWHEGEAEPTGARRRSWRWTSGSADVVVRGAGTDVALGLDGEAPRGLFENGPEVVVRAGTTVLVRRVPERRFAWTVPVDRAVLAAAGGVLTIETSRTFSPADTGRSADRRRLGLRIFACRVQPAPRAAR